MPQLLISRFLGYLLLAAATASAETIFSQFGPSPYFQAGTGLGVNGSDVDPSCLTPGVVCEQDAASQFQPLITSPLASIDIALLWLSGTDSFIVDLAADNAGLPGSVLESFTVTGIPSGGGTIITLDSTLHPLLSSGAQYWLEVFPGNPSLGGGWNLSTLSSGNAPYFSHNHGASWTPTTQGPEAFDVNGTVPEPPAGLFLIAAACVLIARGMISSRGRTPWLRAVRRTIQRS